MQWATAHAGPELRHRALSGAGLRRKPLRQARKLVASRYYRLLSGHTVIGSFLHERMTGPQRLESDKCWWCNCGKRQTRHHLFTECKAWARRIERLWSRISKDSGWKHPRALSVRKLWEEGATEDVLEFLGDTRMGCRTAVRVIGPQEEEGQELEEEGTCPPRAYFLLPFLLSRSFVIFRHSFVWQIWEEGDQGALV